MGKRKIESVVGDIMQTSMATNIWSKSNEAARIGSILDWYADSVQATEDIRVKAECKDFAVNALQGCEARARAAMVRVGAYVLKGGD